MLSVCRIAVVLSFDEECEYSTRISLLAVSYVPTAFLALHSIVLEPREDKSSSMTPVLLSR